MGNQQQNCNLKFTGKTIKPEHYVDIINQYTNGESLMQLGIKYNYNIATIRYFLLRNDIQFHSNLFLNATDGYLLHYMFLLVHDAK